MARLANSRDSCANAIDLSSRSARILFNLVISICSFMRFFLLSYLYVYVYA